MDNGTDYPFEIYSSGDELLGKICFTCEFR